MCLACSLSRDDWALFHQLILCVRPVWAGVVFARSIVPSIMSDLRLLEESRVDSPLMCSAHDCRVVCLGAFFILACSISSLAD